jgi:hypothetical protein
MDCSRTSSVTRLQDQLRDRFFGKPQVARIKKVPLRVAFYVPWVHGKRQSLPAPRALLVSFTACRSERNISPFYLFSMQGSQAALLF